MANNKYYNPQNIAVLVEFCEKYCEIFDLFVFQVKKQNLTRAHLIVSADMLQRSRITIGGLSQILPLFAEHPSHKMSVFLLLRSQLSDILSFLTLMTFVDETDANQTAFKNEIDLLDLDFLKAMLKLHDENERLRNIEGISQLLSSNDDVRIEAIKTELLETYSHLLNIEGKPKKIKDIRATTNDKFFAADMDKKNTGLSNEVDKYERILKYNNYKIIAPIYSLFKYFSQFQHYSRASMFFFKHKHLDYDVINILTSFSILSMVCDLLYNNLIGKGNAYSEQLKDLDNIIMKIFKEEI